MNKTQSHTFERKLADPYAFALLQWPATLGILTIGNQGWGLALNIVLGLWLALMVLAGYAGKRPGRMAFGNTMVLTNVTVGLAYWLHASAWVFLWLGITLLLFYVAQRALFRDPDSVQSTSGDAEVSAATENVEGSDNAERAR